MIILFVASLDNPFNATKGSHQRSCLLLEACSKIAHVDVVSFCTNRADADGRYSIIYQDILDKENEEGRLIKLFHICSPWKPESLYHIDKRREKILDEIIQNKRYDFIVTRYIPDAITCGLMKYADRLIIDIDDSPVDRALNEASMARSFRNKIYLKLFAKANEIGLKKVVSSAYNVFFSNVEQANMWNKPFLPNVPYYQIVEDNGEKRTIAGRILFVGDLDWSPNKLGVSHFIHYVYPLIKRQHPEVTFHIVGCISDESIKKKWESYEGVMVTGFVPNLLNEYNESQLVVIPIYQGAGTCIKVLEAMQMKRPLVTTEVGFRGYSSFFYDKEDCLIAKSDDMFVEYVVSLIESDNTRMLMARSAYVKQQSFFTKDIFDKTVKEVLI